MQGKDVSLTGLSPGILPLLSFLLVLPLSHPLSLWRPSGPHHGSFCSSHMQGVSACPTRINQPVNVRIFVRVLIPLPSFFLSLTCALYTRIRSIHSANPPPSPGVDFSGPEQRNCMPYCSGSSMENGLVKSICEDTDGNELALCLVLTYRPDHVVRAVGQASNKGKGQNVQKVSLNASPSGHLGRKRPRSI